MKRLLAVLGAVAMIGGAVLVRGALTGDDGDGGGGGNGSGGDGSTHLICATELADACAALAEEDGDVTFDVEPAGDTAERLVDPAFRADEADFDGWLTLQPWPALVELRRDLANQGAVLGETSDVLATSPLDIVGPSDRLDALVSGVCDASEGDPLWRCFGDNAGAAWAAVGGDPGWGAVNLGYADPTESATGLLLLGQSSAEYFGALGGDTFASNDFDSAFSSWLGEIADSDPNITSTASSPLEQLLQFGASSWDAVGDVGWTTDAEVTGSRDEDQLTVTYSSFMLAEAVAVSVRGHEIPDFADGDTRNALIEAGFENPTYDTDPADTVSAISPGLYQALIEEWEQVT